MEFEFYSNPFQPTADFWFKQFKVELMNGNNVFAKECFDRYTHWKTRAWLSDYLAQLCNQKEFK